MKPRAAVSSIVRLVAVRTIAPGKGCVLTQALTQPVDIARVPRHEGQVDFEDRPEVRDCS